MVEYHEELQAFVSGIRGILGQDLVGVYLHGSLVMGCFNPRLSDLDLIVVMEKDQTDDVKERLMDEILCLQELAPEKGVEISFVRRDVCKPFCYPTPYDLHFSVTHRDLYRSDPQGYFRQLKGTDPDLAAHFTILRHRGKTLFGESIHQVFDEVPPACYFDSLWYDVKEAPREILRAPLYMTLNLCRVLAYRREGLILSKAEGGDWGLLHLPECYHVLLRDAKAAYAGDGEMNFDPKTAEDFAHYMLREIKK